VSVARRARGRALPGADGSRSSGAPSSAATGSPYAPARPARPSAWSKRPWLRTTAWIWDRSPPRPDHRPGHHRVAAPACGDRRAPAPQIAPTIRASSTGCRSVSPRARAAAFRSCCWAPSGSPASSC